MWRFDSLNMKSAKDAATEVACIVIEALRLVGRHLCARDLFEEMLCAKVISLHAYKGWFLVSVDKYEGKGLKCLKLDVESCWSHVLKVAGSHEKGLE